MNTMKAALLVLGLCACAAPAAAQQMQWTDQGFVNVNVGGLWYVQIRDVSTGAVEFQSTTASSSPYPWDIYFVYSDPTSRPLVLAYGGVEMAPRF